MPPAAPWRVRTVPAGNSSATVTSVTWASWRRESDENSAIWASRSALRFFPQSAMVFLRPAGRCKFFISHGWRHTEVPREWTPAWNYASRPPLPDLIFRAIDTLIEQVDDRTRQRHHEASPHLCWRQEHEHSRHAGRPPGQTDGRRQRPVHSHRFVWAPHGDGPPHRGGSRPLAAGRRWRPSAGHG